MYLLIVFVLNMDSLDFLILILNSCILWINLDFQIFIKSNGVYSSLFWINVGISRPSRRTWWLLLTLKYKDNRWVITLVHIRINGTKIHARKYVIDSIGLMGLKMVTANNFCFIHVP
jgi:hypothetical protein